MFTNPIFEFSPSNRPVSGWSTYANQSDNLNNLELGIEKSNINPKIMILLPTPN